MIQLTDHMKVKKKQDQSLDASVLLRRGNKLIMGCIGWAGIWRKRGGGEDKKGPGSGVGGDRGVGRCTEGQEIKQRCIEMWYRELWIANRKFQMPGKQESPRTQQG
jgi:hypothetical protein